MATQGKSGKKKLSDLPSEAEAAWAAIQGNPLDAVITIDDSGVIRFFNRAARQIFGYAEEEVVGRNVSILMPEPHRSRHDGYLTRYLQTGRKKVVDRIREEWAERKDGSRFPMEMSVVEASSAAGRRFVGVIRDITKRREAQDRLDVAMESLNRSNAELEAVFNLLKVGVCAVDSDGRVRFASLCCQDFFDLGAEDMLGRPWVDLSSADAGQAEAMRALLGQPAPEGRLHTTLRSSDGTPRMVEIEARPDPRNPTGRLMLLYDRTDVHLLRDELDQSAGFHDLVGRSSLMRQLYAQVEQLARFDTTVLVEGETGVGKELVARALHDVSSRRGHPFVPVNTSGLSESLLASQLFGHVRGAFTGAVNDSKGVFETAHRGTLFLDEIGDIPLSQQSSLLRVLQEREIVRVGESMARKVDVRVIAATHRDLDALVKQDLFRQDLRYRLSVAVVRVPSLRERLEDIPALVRHFLRGFSAQMAKPIDAVEDGAMRKLLDHAWPGNVRELKNALEAAVIRCSGTTLREADLQLVGPRAVTGAHFPVVTGTLSPEVAGSPSSGSLAPRPPVAAPTRVTLPSRRRRIVEALTQTQGNRAEAARLLGMGRTTLYRLIEQYGIEITEED